MVSTLPPRPTNTSAELQLAQRLIKVGIALSAERNLERLLKLIVTEAQALTQAEGVSLYLRQGDTLYFKISQNEVLRQDLHASQENLAQSLSLPLQDTNNPSIAAYVVNTGKTLNIADVYQLPQHAPYQFNPTFDRQTGYLTTSMLTVPMRDLMGDVMGALQLVNHQNDHCGNAFPDLEVSVAESLASQAAIAYKNILLEDRLRLSYRDTIHRLSAAAEYRDPETGHHLVRMSHYARIIAQHLGMSIEQQELIFDASPMHDVGKLGIPDIVLLKPGRFTPEERAVMMQHPRIGADILGDSDSELLQMSARIAISHHERFDGTGYPAQLKGEAIPIEGRIVALADVFDALSSKRVYKAAWDIEDVLAKIRQETGKHFDPVVVDAFFAGLVEILEIQIRYSSIS
jgi:HD-GYP domain-containing protein (c-di-GMP phosphodiesterase class II)